MNGSNGIDLHTNSRVKMPIVWVVVIIGTLVGTGSGLAVGQDRLKRQEERQAVLEGKVQQHELNDAEVKNELKHLNRTMERIERLLERRGVLPAGEQR